MFSWLFLFFTSTVDALAVCIVWTQISNYVYFLFLPKIPNVYSILVNDNDRI